MLQRSGITVAAALALMAAALIVGSGARAAEPVGAASCATCHPKAYQTWKRGPHASARVRLSARQQAERRCQACHAPSVSAGLEGVECEDCHGPGTYYVRDYVMRDAELARLVGLEEMGPKVCARCHDATAPSLAPFDYEKKIEAIRHWGDADE